MLGLCSTIDFDGVDVWSEDQIVTIGPLSLVAGRRAMPLDQVPVMLLAECYADYRAVSILRAERLPGRVCQSCLMGAAASSPTSDSRPHGLTTTSICVIVLVQ